MYTISRHSDSSIKALHVADNGLLESQFSGHLPNNGSGAIDVAVNDIDNILFASYDGVNVIEAISTKTMVRVASETISGGTENEIAGLEYFHATNLLLAAERYDTKIRVIEYDAETAEFTRNEEIPMPNVLSGGILGLCLDEEEMRLYISQSADASVVNYYSIDVQGSEVLVEYEGQIPIEWNGQSKIAVGIALYNDGQGKKYLYSSGYNHESSYEHPYLVRTTLDADNHVTDRLGVAVGPGLYVAGVDTDTRTGYLYLTTLGAGSSIRVYDPNQWTSDPNDCQYLQSVTGPDIVGPAGIKVGPNFLDPDRLWIDKQQISPDPNGCVEPGTPVTYRTVFHPGAQEEFNVVLREFLPEESLFISASPDDPNTGWYDPQTHTYTWDVGYLPPLDPNDPADPNHYFEVTVLVTDTAEPSGYMVNVAEVESDDAYAKAQAKTPICCWASDNRIYVDADAAGHNSGVNWANAYRRLSSALERAQHGCGAEIWMADGVYSPGNAISDTFTVPDNVHLYGGFAGTETDPNQRNWAAHPTVLSGYIDIDISGNNVQNLTVVTMGHNTVLDGLTVIGSDHAGAKGRYQDFTVRNCIFRDNDQKAITAEHCNLTVQWCEVSNSGWEGISYSADSNTLAEITNCRIYNNRRDGIYGSHSNVRIVNSLIYQNGFDSLDPIIYSGVNLLDTFADSLLRNNTIVANADAGIRSAGPLLPLVLNCIVWGNGSAQLGGFDADDAAFNSCIQDCNDVNFNLSTDPNFAYDPLHAGNTNFHLAWDSPCVDAGEENSVTDANEFDIDGEMRLFGDRVDIGADEAVACDGELSANDVYHPLDANADGLINYDEFVPLAAAWLCHDPNDPAILTDPNDTNDPNYVSPETLDHWRHCWDPAYNYDAAAGSAYQIDLADVALFYDEYWLWIACWKENEYLRDGPVVP